MKIFQFSVDCVSPFVLGSRNGSREGNKRVLSNKFSLKIEKGNES